MNQHWFQSEFIKANVNKVSQLLTALLCLPHPDLLSHSMGSLCGVAPCDVMAMPFYVVAAHASAVSVLFAHYDGA